MVENDNNKLCSLSFPPELDVEIRRRLSVITTLDGVVRVMVYGSYAKGIARPDSDIDVAVFYEDGAELRQRYRTLAAICTMPQADIQAQVFSIEELDEPCGIIEEILQYGIVFEA